MQPLNSAIISFNYDVVIDIALAKRTDTFFDFSRADVEVLREGDHLDIDYAVDFTNLPPGSMSTGRFQLLKLHGSFNWVMSALSGNLYFGGLQKSVGAIMDYHNHLREPEGSRVEANYRRFFGPIEFYPNGFDAYMDAFDG